MRLVHGEPPAEHWRWSTLAELAETLLTRAGAVTGRPVVVAVDGRSSSGKSTLSMALAGVGLAAHVVHTDDIAWHYAAFAWADELIAGVLEPVSRGEVVDYRPPGWVARSRPGSISVPPGLELLVIEGDGSSRLELAGWYDATIYVQADDVVRHERESRRVRAGDISVEDQAAWTAEEEAFFGADRPWERATLVVCGTPSELDTSPPVGIVAVADCPRVL